VGFEGLIVGIQTMRLHYYEFLGKFFTGGGMRFEPLAITPKEEGNPGNLFILSIIIRRPTASE
jgi:vacuolar-type H+-ATPase subunit I/STV1